MGAIILNDAVIGEGSIVGAGALVSEGKEIPSRSLVLGVPGKIVRQVTDAEFEGIAATQRPMKRWRRTMQRGRSEHG